MSPPQSTCEGWLNKLENSLGGLIRENHRYYFELIEDEIFYWDDDSKSDDSLVDVISLAQCTQVIPGISHDGPGNAELSYGLELDMMGDSERRVLLFADSESDYKKWLDAIINEHKAHSQLEHLNRLGEVTKCVKSGWLHLLNTFSTKPTTDTSSPASWSKSFVRLYPDRLDILEGKSSTARLQTSLRITGDFYVGDSRTHDLAFVFSDFDESFRFYAENKSEKKSWMQNIAQVIRNRGTVNKHQERLLGSQLFQNSERFAPMIAGHGTDPLHSLVKQVSFHEGNDQWMGSRARKQKEIERADAMLRSNLEQKRRERWEILEEQQNRQLHEIVVAREKLARATQLKHEAADATRLARNSALSSAQKEIDNRVSVLEDEMRERLRALAAEEEVDAAEEELSSKTKGKSSKIRTSLSKVGSVLSPKSVETATRPAEETTTGKKSNRFRIGFSSTSATSSGKSKSSKSPRRTKASKSPKSSSARTASTAIVNDGPPATSIARSTTTPMAPGIVKPTDIQVRRSSAKGPVKTPGLLGLIQTSSKTDSSVLNQVEPPPVLSKYGVHPNEKGSFRKPSVVSASGGVSSSNTTSSTTSTAQRPTTPRRESSLLSKVKLWDNKVQEIQMLPISEVVQKEASLKPGDEGYGTARPGTKTAMRAAKAQEWVEKEIDKFMSVVNKIGERGPNGKIQVTFGVLFVAYQDISDTLVGIMKSAKKRKLISYEGDMLFQGLHDHVVITVN